MVDMSREILKNKPSVFGHFPDGKYVYYNLYNDQGGYGLGAVAEHADALEVHIEISRWGPKVARSVMGDAAWLRHEAGRRGKQKVVGVKQEDGPLDTRWPKFTRLIGFTGHSIMQTAFMEAEPATDNKVSTEHDN